MSVKNTSNSLIFSITFVRVINCVVSCNMALFYNRISCSLKLATYFRRNRIEIGGRLREKEISCILTLNFALLSGFYFSSLLNLVLNGREFRIQKNSRQIISL